MSNITKKIFSIEHAGDLDIPDEPSTSDIIRPLAGDTDRIQPELVKTEKVPEFVTREAKEPLSAPPSPNIESTEPVKAGGWVIIGFGVLYLVAAGLYFGVPLVSGSADLVKYAGLVLLLLLPLMLLFLLWRGLRHLSSVNQQNLRLTTAADALVSPDREALNRTGSLAAGIQEQISKVNKGLQDTVKALEGVQIAVTRESQALDAAGVALTNRSDYVGRNLTIQRQALESISGTFDTRMTTLSSQITESGQELEAICTTAEMKITEASKALEKATVVVDETVTSGVSRITENVTSLETASLKLNETGGSIATNINSSTEILQATDGVFSENAEKLSAISERTHSQISDLQATIGHGYEMLTDLRASVEARSSVVATHYEDLSGQIKRSEDETLKAQGETARMVETNLAQIRRDFSKMETDLQSLRSKLRYLREESDNIPIADNKSSRLNLMPLDTDFPPVEPMRSKPIMKPIAEQDIPLNLGADLEIESEDTPITNFKTVIPEADVIRRPGEIKPKIASKGFGRRSDKEEKTGWRWRDMLGTLERPDTQTALKQLNPDTNIQTAPKLEIDGVALLTALQLSPAAIVDEGTIIDATQARIHKGEPGLTTVVIEKLPEAVAHLKENIDSDTVLKANLRSFTNDYSEVIGNTPPTAAALRSALGSPEGRAYLLCAAAFKPQLRS